MFVKICGITTVEDGLLAAGLGADAVGMIFAASSPRRVSIGQASDIVSRLPAEVLPVGVFRNELKERVVEVANAVGLRAVQLHGHEPPEDCRWVGERVPALIKAFSHLDPALTAGGDYGPHRLLVDSPMPGSGEVFDWADLDRLVAGRRYILAGGLHPENVSEAVEMLAPWGVDVSTGVEASPGRKDPSKVRRFLAAARKASESVDRWQDLDGPGLLVDDPPVDVATPMSRPFDWQTDQGESDPWR